ncbi:MAG: FG-GAP-like repeat-containing protein, partial [Bacteroidetes bacterium]|nr:FG-GAP-like repeat-containing protein [Bacteroidota bacterium]
SGSFSAATNFTADVDPSSVISGDFNGDGKVDLAVSNATSNNVSVLLGTGTGSFGTATNFPTGNQPSSVTSADFNEDGIADLAVTNNGSNNVSLLLGIGSGSFSAATNFMVGTNPYSIISHDFNGDGKTDLAVANSGSNTLSILSGTGTGSFNSADNFTVFQNYSVTCADFDEDGKVDLALATASSNLSVLLNCTVFCTGNFGTTTNFSVGAVPYSVTNADFNSDGKIDLVLANGGSDNVSVLLGTGTGGFGTAANFPTGAAPVSVASADFNEDGKGDLAVANSNSGTVSVLLGSGSGSFGVATNFAAGNVPVAVSCADFNRDGKTDLAVVNAGSHNVSILLGNGAGSFGAVTNFATGTNPHSVTCADFNGDGIVDLAVANWNTNNVSVLLGTGSGTFNAAVNFSVGSTPNSLTSADFNGDGKADLAVPNINSANLSILLGTGTGSFSAASNFATGNNPRSVTSADFNGDGIADLAVVNADLNNVSVLFGTGTGSFGAASNFATGMEPQSVISADFNRDGKIDLAVANDGSNNVSILLFDTPAAPTGTAAQSFCSGASPTIGDLAAIGTSIQWYAAPSGGTALSVGTALVNNTHYYASQTISSCGGESSARFDVTATINTTPGAPTGIPAQSFCSGSSPTVANLVATGTNIQWYTASIGGSALTTATALITATDYFATETVGGCESTTRFSVTATVNTTPAVPTGIATQSFCSATSPTVADLVMNGTSIQWYVASFGGSALANTTALVTATDYFSTETVSGCESTTRFGVTATINATPGAPTGTAAQTFCSGASPTVADLTATGTSVQWYALSSGGSALATTTVLVTATDYFATETVNGCESITRFGVTAPINPTPGAPTGTAAQTFCSGTSPTVADLVATGTSVQWYALSSGGSALATATALVTANDYFATETVNGCESTTRSGVTATINTTPGVPTGTATQAFCSATSPIVADLGATGTSIQWYAASIGGSPLATTLALVTATDYFAAATVSGCESTTRFGVTVTVGISPDITTLSSGLTITANQNGAAYQWINCDNANAPLFGQFNQSFTATANGNYAVSITKNGCTDTSSCYNVNNVGIIENTSAETITIYPNPFTSQTTITFTQDQSNYNIKIMDVLGKEIKTLNFIGRELIIEREEMLAGIYFVQIFDRNKNVINRKIIIE